MQNNTIKLNFQIQGDEQSLDITANLDFLFDDYHQDWMLVCNGVAIHAPTQDEALLTFLSQKLQDVQKGETLPEQETVFEVSSAEELEGKLTEFGAENEWKDGVGRGGYLDDPCFICEVEVPHTDKVIIFTAPTPELAKKIWQKDLF